MSVCRVLLRQSAQLHDPSKHGAIDATFYERSAASRHYCQRTSYRVQKLEVMKLVDIETQAILDVLREFRETALMCMVYNIKRAVEQ